jgi:hypothetical protein
MVGAGVPPNRCRRRQLIAGHHVPVDEEPLGCFSFNLQDLAAKKIRDVFDVGPQARALSRSKKSSSADSASATASPAGCTALAAAAPVARAHVCKPSQLPPRDCYAQALLEPHNDGLVHSNQKRGLSMSSTLSPTQSKFSPRWPIPSLEISARHDLESARMSSKPPLRRTIFGFVIAFCLGVAATSGWQSYGEAARGMIANWSEQSDRLAPAPDAHASAPTAAVAPSLDVEEQAAEQEVLQKISEPLPKSPAAPTPSQILGPLSDTFVGAVAAPK